MNTKKTIMSIIITIIAVAIIFGIFVYIRDVKMAEGTVSYNMYYVNSAESCLGIEKKTVNLVDDDKVMFNTVVDEFGSGPKFNNSALVLPSDFHMICNLVLINFLQVIEFYVLELWCTHLQI